MQVEEKKFITTGLPRYSARVPVVPSKRLKVASIGPPARPPPLLEHAAITRTEIKASVRRRNIAVEGSGPHRRAGARVGRTRDEGGIHPEPDRAVAPARSSGAVSYAVRRRSCRCTGTGTSGSSSSGRGTFGGRPRRRLLASTLPLRKS